LDFRLRGGVHSMFRWFSRKPKTPNGRIHKGSPAAEDGRSAWNTAKNVARSRTPLDRDLYGQALKAKGHISLKEVHDEYEHLVRQKLRRDHVNKGENDNRRDETSSKNGQRRNETEVSVKFSSWNIVRGELIRVYVLTNLNGPSGELKVELRCRLITEGTQVMPLVHLLVKPFFSKHSKSVASVFAPSDDLDDYKILIARVQAADAGVNFVTYDIGDGDYLVRVLKLGRQITVQLAESESNQLRYVIPHLALPNDVTFLDRYDFLKATALLGVQYD
jgi:hypothetical protein